VLAAFAVRIRKPLSLQRMAWRGLVLSAQIVAPWPQVLIEKCQGRRICRKCGKGWNIADIYLPAEGERPEIVMPPLDPPTDCIPYMEQREDDKEAVRLGSALLPVFSHLKICCSVWR
jgi:hypothetical protein